MQSCLRQDLQSMGRSTVWQLQSYLRQDLQSGPVGLIGKKQAVIAKAVASVIDIANIIANNLFFING